MLTRLFIGLCLISIASADLRAASHPRNGYGLGGGGGGGRCSREVLAAGKCFYRYMIPSVFSYSGLKYPGGQKYNNYDQFLRSNIDNEQDNRNFDNERGEDHLPFRTYRTQVDTTFATNRFDGQVPRPKDLRKTVKPGESLMVPLRWNNPHAGEMEVNLWIFDHGNGNGPSGKNPSPIVIPLRKPTCSAEGHQDMVISFTIPEDFTKLGGKIPGFHGCTEMSTPMCSLQIYSHSVESRQYAIAFPIIVPGHEESVTTSSSNDVASVSNDPWMDMSSLRELCLPSTDPSARIDNAVPRWARLVSDVYTHSYMNSDFSPYSGQQQEYISRNLQASAINKMVTGNRGELGRSILTSEQYSRIQQLASLEDTIYKNYEALANKIINRIGNSMKNTGKLTVDQMDSGLATCFRCAEVGATNPSRLDTNTYIPSFQIPQSLVAQARQVVPSRYSSLITPSGVVQIYSAAFVDLLPFFFVSHPLGIIYQPAALKEPVWTSYGAKWRMNTMADVSDFKKRDAAGNTDKGVYAATAAKIMLANQAGCPADCLMRSAEVACAGTMMRPLFVGSRGTCVEGGKCAGCSKMFDDYQAKPSPVISPLAAMVAKSGLPKGFGKDMPAAYPDSDGSPRVGRGLNPGYPILAPVNATWELTATPAPTPRPSPPTPAPTPPPTSPCATCGYGVEMCKKKANSLGLQLGTTVYQFDGIYSETGCYAYSSGTYSGIAFYGYVKTMGTEVQSEAQLTAITGTSKYRLECTHGCSIAPTTAPPTTAEPTTRRRRGARRRRRSTATPVRRRSTRRRRRRGSSTRRRRTSKTSRRRGSSVTTAKLRDDLFGDVEPLPESDDCP